MHNAIPMQLLVAHDQTSADLYIMGDISRGHWLFGKGETDTDASDVAKALADLPETCGEITVHINSMGGEVAQGVAIYNALKASKAHVTTVCEGFACSIASVIFMAGDERVMRNASLLMVHEAWMGAQGNAKDLRKAADDLETITELSKRAYMEHATDELTRERLDQLMADETWILPEQALEWGFATSVEQVGEDEEPEQSAMQSVMSRLTEEPLKFKTTQDEIERMAQRVAALVSESLETSQAQQSQPQVEPKTNEPEPEHKSFMQRAALMFANDAR